MNDWLLALHRRLLAADNTVRVAVAKVRGSAPREAGATMLVSADDCEGTIGGGHLEWKAVEIARDLLRHPNEPPSRLDRFTLGATLGQCCGGAVELWFERFCASDADFIDQAITQRGNDAATLLVSALHGDARHQLMSRQAAVDARLYDDKITASTQLVLTSSDGPFLVEPIAPAMRPLWLFGAGHVGKALVHVLAGLPFRVTWIDSREAIFPSCLPANVTALCCDDSADAAGEAPADAMFLVLTHSHDLDYDICRAILSRDDFAWAGLIGSRSKARRFSQRLQRHGFSSQQVARLTCPIGLPGIASKLPAAIAISVAAQVVTLSEQMSEQLQALPSNSMVHSAAMNS